MAQQDIFEILGFFLLFVLLAPPLGHWIARVMESPKHWSDGVARVIGLDLDRSMTARSYLIAVLVFNFAGLLVLLALQWVQPWLPFNTANLPAPSWHLAINSAVSFVTNTNWQSYAGETTYAPLVQMLGFTTQNFVSAAVGLSVMIAFARALRPSPRYQDGSSTVLLGNFWRDLNRATIGVLLPVAVILAGLLISQGVVQTFQDRVTIETVEGAKQEIAVGPAASQIAIKQLGTNGGGYFNANSAHPLENPTPLSNFLQVLAIILIPGALVFSFGRIIERRREAGVIFAVMLFLLALGLSISLYSEFQPNPALGTVLNLEGKETRFGVSGSVLWSTVTTAASNGSVNTMHSSLSPITGMIAMLNMMLGEVIFGGVGSGLYGMLLFAILTVFLAGLMVGRSPEYLGRRIEAFDIKMVLIGLLAPSAAVLFFSALASVTEMGTSSLAHSGAHGLSEILYVFTSAANNNGSAFAGVNGNTPFYNLALSLCMLVGRFAVIVPVLLLAGSLGSKKIAPVSVGTFRTDSILFAGLLIVTILVVGGLTFFPALSLGPILEHLNMLQGQSL